MASKICKNCALPYQGSNGSKYCSKECLIKYRVDNFICETHGKIELKDIEVLSKGEKSVGVGCVRCRRRNVRVRSRRRRSSVHTCLNCQVTYCAVTGGGHKYCDRKCAEEYLLKNFICKIHGKVPSDRISVVFYDNFTACRCLDCKAQKEKKSKRKRNKPIKCRECGVLFSYFGSGAPMLCSKECREIYRKRVGAEFHVKYRDNLTKNYLNCVNKGVVLPEEVLDVQRLQIMLRRKIKELKEQEVG